MALLAYDFWNRIDKLKGDTKLTQIAEATGINYQTLRNQRSENRYPKKEDMGKIADYLSTTVEFLMTGIHIRPADNLCPEARYVQENPEARILVSQIMKDPALLSALAVVIESARKVEGKVK